MAKARIPGGITPAHFIEIRKQLLSVLSETGAKIVASRLNESGKEEPAPVFVGWVEDPELTEERLERNEPDPGLFRFGDTVNSSVYEKILRNGGEPQDRNWDTDRDYREKRPRELSLASKSGVNYQRFAGIVVGDGGTRRCVGTLVAGFQSRPPEDTIDKVDRVLRRWAQGSSELVTFLKSSFELGGTVVRP